LTHNEFLAVTVVAALLISGELVRQYVHEHPKYDAEFYRARDSLLVALSRDSTRIDTSHVSIGDSTSASGGDSSNTAMARTDVGSRRGLIDVNTASTAELVRLPGIGPHLAQRIVAYRDQNGPFRAVRELERVSGIGPRKVEALAPLVVVSP
jgi:competence ComEA-like helix-hairpin-helix protein